MWLTDPSFRRDIFAKYPWLGRLFQGRSFHLSVRIFGDAVFTCIIVLGLFGPQEPGHNIVLFLAWGIWWPSVVLSWFFLGKMWCGFCPFPGIGRILRRFGLGLDLTPPAWLRRYGVRIAVLGLALIFLLEGATGLTQSPRDTALLMLAILAGATLSGLLFEQKIWCMYLCPMGRIIGQAATISMTEFRSDPALCRECATLDCKKGRDGLKGCPVNLGAIGVRNSLGCHVCGYCMKLCTKGSPSLWLRSPFAELIRNKGKYMACTWVLPVLAGSQLVRFLEETTHPLGWICTSGGLCYMLLYAALFALAIVYVEAMIRLGDMAFGVNKDPILGRLSPTVPVIFPLAVTGELVYRLGYFLVEVPDALPTLGRQFGFTAPVWDWGGVAAAFPYMEGVLLFLGFLAGTHVLNRLALDEFPDLVSP
ncbi:MAG: 4Fe-4S binding protein, partial [Desulfovibrio sp.]